MTRKGLISTKIKNKVQDFVAFKLENNVQDLDELSTISDIVPETLVGHIVYTRLKNYLMKFPVFAKMEENFLREISQNLIINIYLPLDYIFHQVPSFISFLNT